MNGREAMYVYGHDACRRATVLPFGGDPSGLAGLRRIVGEQLGSWGLTGLIEGAQLAATELASNVIKHVGEGAPATLVMELEGDYLNLELHDTSSQLPALRPACPTGESGRGLAILAAISVAWGSVPTPTGKAVWCKLASDPTRSVAPASRRRVQRATAVIENYGRESGGAYPHARHSAVLEELATDLIADVIAWLTVVGIDPDDILDRAQMHFEAEVNKN
jgi:hypothetical protein